MKAYDSQLIQTSNEGIYKSTCSVFMPPIRSIFSCWLMRVKFRSFASTSWLVYCGTPMSPSSSSYILCLDSSLSSNRICFVSIGLFLDLKLHGYGSLFIELKLRESGFMQVNETCLKISKLNLLLSMSLSVNQFLLVFILLFVFLFNGFFLVCKCDSTFSKFLLCATLGCVPLHKLSIKDTTGTDHHHNVLFVLH